MGWMALIPLAQFLQTMPLSSIILLFAGGAAYSFGALIYALKKPNPLPGFFGFHELFHLLIILGTVLHYFVVYKAITA
jgi:hemolysin III